MIRMLDNEQLIPQVAQLIDEGHTVTMTARGRSMRPFIEDGRDKVLLAKAGDVKIGDVVLARTREKSYVIHRLTAWDDTSREWELRGDGNLDKEHCSADDILARVVAVLRKKRQKRYEVDSATWKIYSWWWMRLLPVRRYLLGIHRRLFCRKQVSGQ